MARVSNDAVMRVFPLKCDEKRKGVENHDAYPLLGGASRVIFARKLVFRMLC